VHEKNLFPAKKGCRQLQLPVLTAAAAAAALSLVFVLFLLLQVGRCQVREMHLLIRLHLPRARVCGFARR
jgi:hypothetical protein